MDNCKKKVLFISKVIDNNKGENTIKYKWSNCVLNLFCIENGESYFFLCYYQWIELVQWSIVLLNRSFDFLIINCRFLWINSINTSNLLIVLFREKKIRLVARFKRLFSCNLIVINFITHRSVVFNFYVQLLGEVCNIITSFIIL